MALLAGIPLVVALLLLPSPSWPDDAHRATEAAGRYDPEMPPCAGRFAAPRRAIAAITHSSFELDSGEVVSVTGILTRPPFATQNLDEIIRGKAVSLAPQEAPADRWGRIQAQVFVHADKPGTSNGWLQSKLVAEGRALAFASPDLQPCQTELLEREADARQQMRGIWATDLTLTRSADAREALAGDEGTFRIVEGRVRRVSESRGRIYLNFGRNWRQDFTALIPADIARSWPKPAPDFQSLRGKTVRVRGWVRNRNGPMIVIESHSMLDAPDLKKSPASGTQTSGAHQPRSHP